MSYLTTRVSRVPIATPQTVKAKATQVPNSGGGFAFKIDPFERLQRFLILGTEGGTYYASQKDLTKQNIECVKACLDLDATQTIDDIVEVSQGGRAIKNDPAIYALAMAISYGIEEPAAAGGRKVVGGNAFIRRYAGQQVPKVCRTGSHLLTFIGFMNELRGWGRIAKRAVQEWYISQEYGHLAYQVAKYQQRNGWSQRDALRLAKPTSFNLSYEHGQVLRWAVGKDVERPLVGTIELLVKAKEATSAKALVPLIEAGLPHECIPTEFKTDVTVWEALLYNSLPLTALIRNLGNMTSYGVIQDLGKATRFVTERLTDAHYLRKSRVHPMAILNARAVYGFGEGIKGSNTWKPVSEVYEALEVAFYASFDNAPKTGKSFYIGLDISGSMEAPASGTWLSCRDAAAALAMVIAKTEPSLIVKGFSTKLLDLTANFKRRTLEDAYKGIIWNYGGTDCAAPIIDAADRRLDVDCFITITDNETNSRSMHPFKALERYHQFTGKVAKNIVVGMTSTGFSIADPQDGNSLDVVGFDVALPQIVAQFVGGKNYDAI